MRLKIREGGARLLTSQARAYARPTKGMRCNETSLLTLALTPTLSPGRGRILCRLNQKPASGFAKRPAREPESRLTLFPLLGGEGQGEGGQQTILFFTGSPQSSKGQR